MIEDIAYAHYFSNEYFDYVKEKHSQYFSLFNYPVVSNVRFIDDNGLKYQKMNRIRGLHRYDKDHDMIVIRKILKKTDQAAMKINDDGLTEFLQHGDAKRENIIWMSDNDFAFIDLDDIGYYPPFFDVIHYIASSGGGLSTINEAINANPVYFADVCRKSNIDIDNNPLDEIISRYVLVFKKMGGHQFNYRFLGSEDLENFPKTKSVVIG